MKPAPFRQRLRLVAAAGVLAGAFGLIGHATASPAGPAVAGVDDEYWACLALDHVEIGTCIGNPLPDLSEADTVDDVIQVLLDDL